MFFHNQEVYNVNIHDHERLSSWYSKWFRYHFQPFALTITFILFLSSMKFYRPDFWHFRGQVL